MLWCRNVFAIVRAQSSRIKRLNERAEVKRIERIANNIMASCGDDLVEKHGLSFNQQFHRQDEDFKEKEGSTVINSLNQLNLLEKT